LKKFLHLRNHSQSLITQIKKLKNKKRCNNKKLEQLINKDSLIDKETMTDLVELGISSDVEVQTTDTKTLANPSVSTNKISMINKVTQVYEEDIIPKVNQENSKIMIKKNQVTRKPYLHPNHKSQHFN
jgi:hypothetical protein